MFISFSHSWFRSFLNFILVINWVPICTCMFYCFLSFFKSFLNKELFHFLCESSWESICLWLSLLLFLYNIINDSFSSIYQNLKFKLLFFSVLFFYLFSFFFFLFEYFLSFLFPCFLLHFSNQCPVVYFIWRCIVYCFHSMNLGFCRHCSRVEHILSFWKTTQVQAFILKKFLNCLRN